MEDISLTNMNDEEIMALSQDELTKKIYEELKDVEIKHGKGSAIDVAMRILDYTENKNF